MRCKVTNFLRNFALRVVLLTVGPRAKNNNYMEEILKYFPLLTAEQRRQIAMLDALYRDWNSKINVISRKDIDNLYVHHVLHSLAIAKFISFKPGTRVLDFGTGGGFPGIPLAIMFPEVSFRLIDGTGKKIRVATEVATALGLKNVEAVHLRGEEEKRQVRLHSFESCHASARFDEDCQEKHWREECQRHRKRGYCAQGW